MGSRLCKDKRLQDLGTAPEPSELVRAITLSEIDFQPSWAIIRPPMFPLLPLLPLHPNRGSLSRGSLSDSLSGLLSSFGMTPARLSPLNDCISAYNTELTTDKYDIEKAQRCFSILTNVMGYLKKEEHSKESTSVVELAYRVDWTLMFLKPLTFLETLDALDPHYEDMARTSSEDARSGKVVLVHPPSLNKRIRLLNTIIDCVDRCMARTTRQVRMKGKVRRPSLSHPEILHYFRNVRTIARNQLAALELAIEQEKQAQMTMKSKIATAKSLTLDAECPSRAKSQGQNDTTSDPRSQRSMRAKSLDTRVDTRVELQQNYYLERDNPYHFSARYLLQHLSFWKEYIRPTGISFPRYIATNPNLTQEKIAQLMLKDANRFKYLEEHKLNMAPKLVKYVTPEERFQYQVELDEQGLVRWCKGEGDLFDTTAYKTDRGKGWAMIVFAQDVGFFTHSHITDKFHHSSLLAGNPVNFAGEWQVAQGRIKSITGKSGHYKPGRREAFIFLRALKRGKIELDGIDFFTFNAEGGDADLVQAGHLYTELFREYVDESLDLISKERGGGDERRSLVVRG